jgi:hypothetical protein
MPAAGAWPYGLRLAALKAPTGSGCRETIIGRRLRSRGSTPDGPIAALRKGALVDKDKTGVGTVIDCGQRRRLRPAQ